MQAARFWRTIVLGIAVAVIVSFHSAIDVSRLRVGTEQQALPGLNVNVTTADAAQLFAPDRSAPQFSPHPIGGIPQIEIDERRRFQTIDGFGVELTGSSAYLLDKLADHGAALLGELFRSDTGIGLSYVRLTIGASDFSLGSYTYDDVAPGRSDPRLASFSVARDADVLSVVQAIHSTSSDVRFMASPWTAPAWMKSNQRLFGGGLKPQSYAPYARYLVMYARALQSRGIALDALTPQNEPQLDSNSYPSMTLTAGEERALVRRQLGPALASEFPAIKLVISDHNWDGNPYPLAILSDPLASRFVAGSAFHCYAGDVRQMSDVQRNFPAKAVYLDECSGGSWSAQFRDNLSWDMRNLIIGGTTNWARTVLLGNLALDDAGGPVNGGCANCRGLVTIHADGTFTRNVEFYVLAHAAKYIRPGAVRIASSMPLGAALPNVAFVNVDGSKVLLVFNASSRATTFAVRAAPGAFHYSLQSGAVATFRWL